MHGAPRPFGENGRVVEPRLQRSYRPCRSRFQETARAHGARVQTLPIAARGPTGEVLTIDLAVVGSPQARRALVVLSGVHGVEAFACSRAQCELLVHLGATRLPPDVRVVVVHGVNPWGMAWGRRQNEANVDLNRNWQRSVVEPVHNDAYDELHHLACPDTTELPSVDHLLEVAGRLVAEHGLDWVRAGLTAGQYRHPDGLHYGGERTEESNQLLEAALLPLVDPVEESVVVDLHTGHGPWGELTLLVDAGPGSDDGCFWAASVPGVRIEHAHDDPEATVAPKVGQIANGLRDQLRRGGATAWSTTLEVGTVPDLEQLVATYLEQWVYRHGDRRRPDHAEVCRRFARCFTPDDPGWEQAAVSGMFEALTNVLTAVMDSP